MWEVHKLHMYAHDGTFAIVKCKTHRKYYLDCKTLWSFFWEEVTCYHCLKIKNKSKKLSIRMPIESLYSEVGEIKF